MGFVFIEANVKKWGLAPMTGSLAPPPPYGSEQGSILLEAGREGTQSSSSHRVHEPGHSRTRSGIARIGFPSSPGPQRSPTDISLSHLIYPPSSNDVGEGSSSFEHGEASGAAASTSAIDAGLSDESQQPPEYTSPEGSRRSASTTGAGEDEAELNDRTGGVPVSRRGRGQDGKIPPPIPSYDAAVGNIPDTSATATAIDTDTDTDTDIDIDNR
jgi:hypothetical protein